MALADGRTLAYDTDIIPFTRANISPGAPD